MKSSGQVPKEDSSGKISCFLTGQCSSCCTKNVPLPKLAPVNLIVISKVGKKISPNSSHLHGPFFYMGPKGLGTESLADHGSLNWAEDVPAPSLQGESYFCSAIMDGATRMCAMPAGIQKYIWIEHLLPKTCRVQHPRGACEFGYTIKKLFSESHLNFCSFPEFVFFHFRQQKTNSAINSVFYGCQNSRMEHINWNKLVGFFLTLFSPETSPIISWNCYILFLTNHFVCQADCCLNGVFFHNFINQAQLQCFSCWNVFSCHKKRNKVTTVEPDGQFCSFPSDQTTCAAGN